MNPAQPYSDRDINYSLNNEDKNVKHSNWDNVGKLASGNKVQQIRIRLNEDGSFLMQKVEKIMGENAQGNVGIMKQREDETVKETKILRPLNNDPELKEVILDVFDQALGLSHVNDSYKEIRDCVGTLYNMEEVGVHRERDGGEEVVELQIRMSEEGKVTEEADKKLFKIDKEENSPDYLESLKAEFGKLNQILDPDERRIRKHELGNEIQRLQGALKLTPSTREKNVNLLKEIDQEILQYPNPMVVKSIRDSLRIDDDGNLQLYPTEDLPFPRNYTDEQILLAKEYEQEFLSQTRKKPIHIDDPDFHAKIIDFMSGIILRAALIDRLPNFAVRKRSSALMKAIRNADVVFDQLKKITSTKSIGDDRLRGRLLNQTFVKLIGDNKNELAAAACRGLKLEISGGRRVLSSAVLNEIPPVDELLRAANRR